VICKTTCSSPEGTSAMIAGGGREPGSCYGPIKIPAKCPNYDFLCFILFTSYCTSRQGHLHANVPKCVFMGSSG
jgi:hypothetical protein